MSNITKQVLFIERAGTSTRSTFNILDAEGYLAESDVGVRIAETENNNHSFEVTGHVVADKFRGRSDQQLKDNVKDISANQSWEVLKRLQGKSYNLKTETSTSYGFIAQEVQKILPEIVSEDVDGQLMLSYMEFIPFMVECIKDLRREIHELKSQFIPEKIPPDESGDERSKCGPSDDQSCMRDQ